MQRMERAIAQELQDSPLIIRKTGLFDDVDEKYGDPQAMAMMTGATGMEQGMEGGMGGGLGGNMGGGLEGMPEPDAAGLGGGGDFGSPDALPPVIGQGQGFGDKSPILGETDKYVVVKRPKISEGQFNSIIEKVVYGENKEKKKNDEKKSVIKENELRNHKLNETATNMVNEIDKLLQDSNNINPKKHKVDESKIDIIDDIDLDLDKEKGDS
jgi:hypothetical protein